MSLISFLMDAGEKLMQGGAAAGSQAQPPVQATETAAQAGNGSASVDLRANEQGLERAILDYMAAQDLPIQDVTVRYDSSNSTVIVSGSVPEQQTREKMILCCGNVQGVSHVDDQLSVNAGDAAGSQFYTVQSGDSLSKIAQDVYGDAGRYQTIFEANQPMLSDPNRVYPGQTLRIPQHA